MSKPKEYQLETMADLMKIPVSRFDAFMVDLKTWHKMGKDTLKMINAIAKVVGEPPAEKVSMKWIDDGLHEKKIIIKSTEVKS